MKVYFYQSDIDAFNQAPRRLAEQAQRGDISFAYTCSRPSWSAIDERIKMVDQLLAMPHDFTVDEEMVDRQGRR